MPSVDIEGTIDEVNRFLNLFPTGDINNPLIAHIQPLKGYLIHPEIYLDIQFYVERVKSDGSTEAIADTDNVALANYPLMSLFRSHDVEFRRVRVMPAATATNYTSIIRVLQGNFSFIYIFSLSFCID